MPVDDCPMDAPMDAPMDEMVQRGIELFNAREFFESHEVLEEVWTP